MRFFMCNIMTFTYLYIHMFAAPQHVSTSAVLAYTSCLNRPFCTTRTCDSQWIDELTTVIMMSSHRMCK